MDGDKKKRPKAQIPTALARVDDVIRLRLEGYERRDILAYVRTQANVPGSCWHVEGEGHLADRTIDKAYVARADAAIREKHDAGRAEAKRRHLAQRRHLYKRALLKGDEGTAAKILKDEAELLGLYPEKKKAVRATIDHQGARDDIAAARAWLASLGVIPPDAGGAPPGAAGPPGPPPA